jgi:hypothetical protein
LLLVHSTHSLYPSGTSNILVQVLVGGFGESPYLQSRLDEHFCAKSISLIYTDEQAKKAVAEGSGLWYLDFMTFLDGKSKLCDIGSRNSLSKDVQQDRAMEYLFLVESPNFRTTMFYSENVCGLWVQMDTIIVQDISRLFATSMIWPPQIASLGLDLISTGKSGKHQSTPPLPCIRISESKQFHSRF